MIIQCEECGNNISDEAPNCPKCGIRRVTKTEKAERGKEEIIKRKLAEAQQQKTIITNLFTVLGIVFFAVFYITHCTTEPNYKLKKESQTSSNMMTKKEIISGKGFPIPNACNYLSSLSGYDPGQYKSSSPDSNDYECGTPYKNIGKASGPMLPNNIAYYVSGSKADVADTIKIVVNINQPKYVKQARNELSMAVNQLFISVFERSPPEDMIKKIISGKDGSWSYGSHVITFKKIKWKGGKGFEYSFVLKT